MAESAVPTADEQLSLSVLLTGCIHIELRGVVGWHAVDEIEDVPRASYVNSYLFNLYWLTANKLSSGSSLTIVCIRSSGEM